MPALFKLTFLEEDREKQEFVFDQPVQCVIGRADDCDIRLPKDVAHADVSRHHCLLEVDPPAVRIRDLGSRNGTFVNGDKIGQRQPHQPPEDSRASESASFELKDGDQVQVGHTVFRVGILVEQERPEPVYFPMAFV